MEELHSVGAPHVEDLERLEEERELLEYAESAKPSPEALEILSRIQAEDVRQHAYSLLFSCGKAQ